MSLLPNNSIFTLSHLTFEKPQPNTKQTATPEYLTTISKTRAHFIIPYDSLSLINPSHFNKGLGRQSLLPSVAGLRDFTRNGGDREILFWMRGLSGCVWECWGIGGIRGYFPHFLAVIGCFEMKGAGSLSEGVGRVSSLQPSLRGECCFRPDNFPHHCCYPP